MSLSARSSPRAYEPNRAAEFHLPREGLEGGAEVRDEVALPAKQLDERREPGVVDRRLVEDERLAVDAADEPRALETLEGRVQGPR